MSFEHVWPQLRALRSEEAASSGVEWKSLYPFRSRPLLVPTADPAQAHAAVALFVDNRFLRWLGYALLWSDRVCGGRVLPSARLNEFPVDVLFGPEGKAGVPYAAQFGSPGPLSKLTVFSPAHGGIPGKVAKVALGPSADESVRREARWLKRLGTSPVAPFVPQLLAQGVLPCGRAFVTMTVVPDGVSSANFGEVHRAFLALLAEAGRGSSWSAAIASDGLRQRLAAVTSLLNPSFEVTAGAALIDIETRLGASALPACLVHGDFAVWNIRLVGEHLYVFDWEYAEENGSPLQDFLHFHLITRATQRGRGGAAYMRALMAQAERYANKSFGPESGVAGAAGPLALHYLLDTVTFYVEASRQLDLKHVVIRTYLSLLDERANWLPGAPFQRGSHE